MNSRMKIGMSFLVMLSLLLGGCQNTQPSKEQPVSTGTTADNSTDGSTPAVAPEASIPIPDAFKGKWFFKEDDFYTVVIDDTTMVSGDSDSLYSTEEFKVVNFNQFSNTVELGIHSFKDEEQDSPKSVNVKVFLTLKDEALTIRYEASDANEATETVWIKKK